MTTAMAVKPSAATIVTVTTTTITTFTVRPGASMRRPDWTHESFKQALQNVKPGDIVVVKCLNTYDRNQPTHIYVDRVVSEVTGRQIIADGYRYHRNGRNRGCAWSRGSDEIFEVRVAEEVEVEATAAEGEDTPADSSPEATIIGTCSCQCGCRRDILSGTSFLVQTYRDADGGVDSAEPDICDQCAARCVVPFDCEAAGGDSLNPTDPFSAAFGLTPEEIALQRTSLTPQDLQERGIRFGEN